MRGQTLFLVLLQVSGTFVFHVGLILLFIVVLVNLHLVRGLMIGGVSDSCLSFLTLDFRTSEMLSSSASISESTMMSLSVTTGYCEANTAKRFVVGTV